VTETFHLHPTAPLAERVLLPGDPGRAMRLAQHLIDAPKMFNHNRGLWGYSGPAKSDGAVLTIQSTGMGGPSAAIVASELIELGARRLLRVGTCGALVESLSLGDLLVVTEAIAADGTSVALGAGARVGADPDLLEALGRAGDSPGAAGPAVSSDLFYDSRGLEREWVAAGALAVEMEAATVFALAAARGVQAGALLLVTDVLVRARERIGAEELLAGELRMGSTAIKALAMVPSS
jgi:uridine phosphorylase